MLAIVKEYFLNSSLHGLRFIADPQRHWTERIFWVCCCILAWVGTALLIESAWQNYVKNPIQFVSDTTYKDWRTDFPSVTICETQNEDLIWDAIERVNNPENVKLIDVFKELAFFTGETYFMQEVCFKDGTFPDNWCPRSNLSQISMKLRTPCLEAFKYCSWNDVNFDCCNYFMPLETENGLCYSINSLNTKQPDAAPLNMFMSRAQMKGKLKVWTNIIGKVFMHSREDIPTINMAIAGDVINAKTSLKNTVLFLVKETDNDLAVRDVSIKFRRCRFPDESNLHIYKYYSYNGCVMQCRKDYQLRMCNCSSPIMPGNSPDEECNITGLFCLNKLKMSVPKPAWDADSTAFKCDCLPSCSEMQIDRLMYTEIPYKYNYGLVELIFSAIPTERFVRNVVNDKLDLVVSMGGTTGLFVGASLLSFVEIFYFFLIRPRWSAAAHQPNTEAISEKPVTRRGMDQIRKMTELKKAAGIRQLHSNLLFNDPTFF